MAGGVVQGTTGTGGTIPGVDCGEAYEGGDWYFDPSIAQQVYGIQPGGNGWGLANSQTPITTVDLGPCEGDIDQSGFFHNVYHDVVDNTNDIRWGNANTQNGINSVAPVINPANNSINGDGGWGHNQKTTKYITELIAMDWGKGEVDDSGFSLAKGMDYRHRSYDGENTVVDNWEPNMGHDSPYLFSIIEQSPNIVETFVNTSGSNLPYAEPGPRGYEWIQDIKNETRNNATFDFGCYPSEFISCSGFNQKNCSLAARMRQIYADERADVFRLVTNGLPTDPGMSNYRPIVLSKSPLMGWNSANITPLENNNGVNGGDGYSLTSLGDFMTDGIPLEGIVSNADSSERGFPMGFFFDICKFIVSKDDQINDTFFGSWYFAYDLTRTYRLKAGFKFVPSKNDIPGYNDMANNGVPFNPDSGNGIHLGGNNEVNPTDELQIDTTSNDDDQTYDSGGGSGNSYQVFSYLHHDLGGPYIVATFTYPSFTLILNGQDNVDAPTLHLPFTSIGLNSFNDGVAPLNNGVNVFTFGGQGYLPDGNDVANLFHYEFKDDYHLFSGGVLTLGAGAPAIYPFRFINVATNFNLRINDPALHGLPFTASFRDQNGDIIKNNLGLDNVHMDTFSQYTPKNVKLNQLTEGDNAVQMPLAIDGTTGWTSTDYNNGLAAPSSPNAPQVNGAINQIYVGLEFPSGTDDLIGKKIFIEHVDKPDLDYLPSANATTRGFHFSPVEFAPGIGFTDTDIY